MQVTLFNPLPATLAHYEVEVDQTLGRIGIDSRRLSPSPATDSQDAGRARRLVAHSRGVGAARTGGSDTLVLWPALGWIEPALWAGPPRTSIMVHDPRPLRKQYGQGRIGLLLGRALSRWSAPDFICHTQDAAVSTAEQLGLEGAPPVCLHPVLTDPPPSPGYESSHTVLVAGQHKPTRDLELLRHLGPLLRARGYRPCIAGRGWPAISGWDVIDEFLSERNLAAMIAGATAVVLPYDRYWQSGIAVRALEAGVPVVGTPTSFLKELFGSDNPGLVQSASDPGAWADVVEAVEAEWSDQADRRLDYRQRVDSSWAALFAELGWVASCTAASR
jgi:hypothetical protein